MILSVDRLGELIEQLIGEQPVRLPGARVSATAGARARRRPRRRSAFRTASNAVGSPAPRSALPLTYWTAASNQLRAPCRRRSSSIAGAPPARDDVPARAVECSAAMSDVTRARHRRSMAPDLGLLAPVSSVGKSSLDADRTLPLNISSMEPPRHPLLAVGAGVLRLHVGSRCGVIESEAHRLPGAQARERSPVRLEDAHPR